MARKTEGKIYQRGSVPNWYADYTINGKRARQLLRDNDGNTITDKEVAEKILADLLNPLKLNDKIEQARVLVSSVVTLEKKAKEDAVRHIPIKCVWDNFMSSPNRSDCGNRTLSDYSGYWRMFSSWLNIQEPKPIHLQEVNADIAVKYAAELVDRGVSAGTYNKHITFLKMLFRVLGKIAGVKNNPFDEIKLKKNRVNSRRELTIEELYKILDAATGNLALLLGLGTFTGLRLGDCCTMKWSEIDLVQRIIKRKPNKTINSSGDPVIVGIPGPLYDRLKETPIDCRKGYLLPEYAEKYNFINANGHYVRRGDITDEIQKHFKVCDIETSTKEENKRAVVEVGFHSLRHTYVSLHARSGTPGAIIQRNVGHANPAMTEHYTHVSADVARKTAAALENTFGRSQELSIDVCGLLAAMTSNNWQAIRDELLKNLMPKT